MNIEYSWDITELERESQLNDLTDVVIRVRYKYIGTDLDSQETGEFFGATPMPQPSLENFIPYSGLTQQDIIVWIEQNANMEHMQESIQNQINNKLNPTIIDSKLPWN